MSLWYILDKEKNVIPVQSSEEEKLFRQDPNAIRVGYAEIPFMNIYISTVFLGMDHSFLPDPVPLDKLLVFETMVFENEYSTELERYATWWQALDGHDRMVKKVMKRTRWKRFWRQLIFIIGISQIQQ